MGTRFVLFLCCSLSLLASHPKKVINYEVSYIGIPLLDMVLTWEEKDSSVHISYDNKLKPFIAYFHEIHNTYTVEFDKNSFSPLSWSKTVLEGDLQFQLSAERSGYGRTVNFSNGETKDFPTNAYTVFSATHYLASKASQADYFPATIKVFIDGEIWQARAYRFDRDNPHPEHHLESDEILIQTDLHYLSGKSLIADNDILTNVIATEGTQFLLWVTPEGTYTKAQFGRFPKAVLLNMIKN